MSIDAVRPRVPLAAGAIHGLKFFRLSECLWCLRELGLVALLQLGLPSSFLALSRCPQQGRFSCDTFNRT